MIMVNVILMIVQVLMILNMYILLENGKLKQMQLVLKQEAKNINVLNVVILILKRQLLQDIVGMMAKLQKKLHVKKQALKHILVQDVMRLKLKKQQKMIVIHGIVELKQLLQHVQLLELWNINAMCVEKPKLKQQLLWDMIINIIKKIIHTTL